MEPDEQGYGLNIEMYALAEPLEFTAEDLKKDYMTEIEALVEKLEQTDVQEATDQVHEKYGFVLCAGCRDALHQRLKGRLRNN